MAHVPAAGAAGAEDNHHKQQTAQQKQLPPPQLQQQQQQLKHDCGSGSAETPGAVEWVSPGLMLCCGALLLLVHAGSRFSVAKIT
jgi:hypothetical protein